MIELYLDLDRRTESFLMRSEVSAVCGLGCSTRGVKTWHSEKRYFMMANGYLFMTLIDGKILILFTSLIMITGTRTNIS